MILRSWLVTEKTRFAKSSVLLQQQEDSAEPGSSYARGNLMMAERYDPHKYCFLALTKWAGLWSLAAVAAPRTIETCVESWFALRPLRRRIAFSEIVHLIFIRRAVMWFSVGILELGLVGVVLLTATILAVLRLRAWRWAMIGVACAIVAAIISPADPLSTILLGAVFFIFFVSGTRFGRRLSVAAT